MKGRARGGRCVKKCASPVLAPESIVRSKFVCKWKSLRVSHACFKIWESCVTNVYRCGCYKGMRDEIKLNEHVFLYLCPDVSELVTNFLDLLK